MVICRLPSALMRAISRRKKLIDRDIIMDHLMEDGVLDEVFGEVDARVDAEDEVLVSDRSEEP